VFRSTWLLVGFCVEQHKTQSLGTVVESGGFIDQKICRSVGGLLKNVVIIESI